MATVSAVGVLLLILLAHAAAAFGHVGPGQAGGFVSGLRHPASGLDHVLAMISVGLWGAQLGAPAVWLLPIAFPMAMATGGMLGLLGIPLPGTEIGIAVSAVLLGGAVMTESRLPLAAAAILIGFFAVFHGYAHGAELPPGDDALLYSFGFVIATGCLHAIGIAAGLIHRWHAGRIALRIAGGGVGLAGLVFLWRAAT